MNITGCADAKGSPGHHKPQSRLQNKRNTGNLAMSSKNKISVQRSAMLRAFGEKRGVIENFEYLDEFEEDFRKCWLYCVLYLLVTERCQQKVKKQIMKIWCMCTFTGERRGQSIKCA